MTSYARASTHISVYSSNVFLRLHSGVVISLLEQETHCVRACARVRVIVEVALENTPVMVYNVTSSSLLATSYSL